MRWLKWYGHVILTAVILVFLIHLGFVDRNDFVLIATALIFTGVPDLDLKVKWLPHRTVTHSLLFVVFVGLVLWKAYGTLPYGDSIVGGAVIGLVSHIIGDNL